MKRTCVICGRKARPDFTNNKPTCSDACAEKAELQGLETTWYVVRDALSVIHLPGVRPLDTALQRFQGAWDVARPWARAEFLARAEMDLDDGGAA